MTTAPPARPTRPPLRLWPGIALVVLQYFVWLVLPRLVAGNAAGYGSAFGALIGGILIALWWLFFSRARWAERLGALGLMALAVFATRPLLHESMATAGQGFMFFVYAFPALSLGLVVWAAATRRLEGAARWATMIAAIVIASGIWTLVRTEGVADTGGQLAWRWSPTAEERLLARGAEEPTGLASASALLESEAEWPGFRGRARDGVVRGVRIATDWSSSPPVELWRRQVGPGWSSFAVHGDLAYTQEQRGEDEVVACYRASTGAPVWRHADPVRFWESNAGAGPRATPTLDRGRVYTFGGTGILNALDAADGRRVWSRDVAADTGRDVPYWGFAASPLVIEDVVVVAAAGQLVGYDRETGELRWTGPKAGGYSSPHLATLGGVDQVVLLNSTGAVSLSPTDGSLLWELEVDGGRIVQPAVTANGDVLIGSNPTGTRRVALASDAGGWNLTERWTSNRLKPDFNDFVVHRGHAFGFDDNILASIDLETGERNWKGGRYGKGQLVLLADQDLLLVVSEKGELVLVSATPDRFTEITRFQALEGKTWNHPVVVGDLLLVRNSEQMAAFRLPLAKG